MTTKAAWWQTTKTARQGFWLGGGMTIFGLIELVLGFSGPASDWQLLIGAGFLAIGAAHLTSAVALHRRQLPAVGSNGQSDASPPAFPPSS